MRYTLAIIIVTVWSVLLGCSSSQPLKKEDEAKKISSFSTGRCKINIDFSENAIANSGQVFFQVRANCDGTDCIPQTANLTFYLASGSSDVYLSERSLSIYIDGKRYHWIHEWWPDPTRSPPVVGRIITVKLNLDELEAIAKSETVTGSLASQSFTWSYEKRKPLRTLLNKMKNEQGDVNPDSKR